MKIKIDGKEIKIENTDKNIVEVAKKAGINITAPCYRNGRSGGCCKACLIKVDGKESYACGTTPQDGMDIIYNNSELKAERTRRLKRYATNIKNKEVIKNSCNRVIAKQPINHSTEKIDNHFQYINEDK